MNRTLELQRRDLSLFCGLLDARVMTLQQVALIYFSRKLEYTRKRIQLLKATGYIDERPRQANEPAILFLTKKAFTALQECGELQSYPQIGWAALEKRIRVSKSTIAHELQVQDVRAALTAALQATANQKLSEFKTWPALYQFSTRRGAGFGRNETLVKPDGYLQIVEQKDGAICKRTFFLEVDCSTETQDTLALKGASYAAYYKDGGYAEWLGKPRVEFRDHPFCVLMVLQNVDRRNNIAERLLLLTPPIRRQVWLTTWKELIGNPLGAIWMQPGEYFEVIKGTAFDPHNSQSLVNGYRRVAQREEVERSLNKRKLLEP